MRAIIKKDNKVFRYGPKRYLIAICASSGGDGGVSLPSHRKRFVINKESAILDARSPSTPKIDTRA